MEPAVVDLVKLVFMVFKCNHFHSGRVQVHTKGLDFCEAILQSRFDRARGEQARCKLVWLRARSPNDKRRPLSFWPLILF